MTAPRHVDPVWAEMSRLPAAERIAAALERIAAAQERANDLQLRIVRLREHVRGVKGEGDDR